MFRDAWDLRLAQAPEASKGLKASVKQVEKQIDQLLDRIVDASNDSVVAAYEKRIAKLEREKVLAEEQLAQSGSPRHTFEESFEHAMRFFASPWIYGKILIWRSRKPSSDWHLRSHCPTAGIKDFEHLIMPFHSRL